MKNKISITRAILAALVVALMVFGIPPLDLKVVKAQNLPSVLAKPFNASRFYWQGSVINGNSTTGAVSVTVASNWNGSDGTPLSPSTIFATLAPITIDYGQSAQETVTPTSVSVGSCPAGNIGVGGSSVCATINGTFNNTHGQSAIVVSGTAGLQEALNYAFQYGGGLVVVDAAWTYLGGTNAIISAAIPYWNVAVQDMRTGQPRYWRPTPSGAALAVPTTLTSQAACDATHQTCSDATVAGSASWGSTAFFAIAYVDCMGNEGPASLTSASITTVASKAIDIGAPAASAGACGWIGYASLSGGTYAQAYQIPPTGSCQLSTLTPQPTCALANANYAGTTTSTTGALSTGLFTKGGIQFTGYPLNTSQHFTKLASVAMTAASLTPVSNSSVSYTYAPSNGVGNCGISPANVINYAASGSSATLIPNAVATWTVPANCFNYIGAEFRVSGKFTFTDGGDTTSQILVAWDAPLSNATTVPTTLCSMVVVATGAAAAQNATYSCTVRTATIGATGTALVNGWSDIALAAGQTTLVRSALDTAVAPSAATVNFTAPARIVVYFIGTGATNNPGAQGLEATLEVLN